MKILMLGWEYAPHISGGLGIATHGMAEALAAQGHEVTYLLPKKGKKHVSKKVKLLDARTMEPDYQLWTKKKEYLEIIRETELGTHLVSYLPPQIFVRTKEKQVKKIIEEESNETRLLREIKISGTYGVNLNKELLKYALLAVQVASENTFDLVHAHDWVTFPAGSLIKKRLGIPFVAHMHSTEHDRNGQFAQPQVIDEEKKGLSESDMIISVSQILSRNIIRRYQINPLKMSVVPNATNLAAPKTNKKRTPKNIAFIGRLTYQKGPGTFIDIVRDLYSRGHDFEYLVIGDGFLKDSLQETVARSNFKNRIRFTGFMERSSLLRKLSEIDLLVVPSESEPFGLVILEAIQKNIPVAAADGSGVAEFIPSLPQVARWDQYNFIQLIEKLMTDEAYRSEIILKCQQEASGLSWKKSAELITGIYERLLQKKV